jgi:aryl-alcohol dehydrogenase-like predicted oxidoreductase
VLGALDAGVNFFDTADTYGLGASEQMLGDALRGAGRRDEAVIATKFGMDMQGENGDDGGRRGSAAYVRRAAEASLRRLGVDHIDLYQLHTPDPGTPIEETLGAMTELVREGKVRAIGCSNLQAWQLVGAHHRAKAADLEEFVTAQNEYSLYNRTAEVELVPACETLGVSILPYFPLAYGLLTGKYHRGQRPPEGSRLESETHRYENADWDTVDALRAFGEARGLSLLQVAIGGLAAQRAVGSVIAGATRAEQVVANVEAAQWQPSEDDLAELAGIGRPRHSYTTFAPRH